MRRAFLVLFAWAAGGCSTKSPAPADAGLVLTAEDGSSAGCTAQGGTCVPYASSDCPPLQQNPQLCEDVTLLCCLPEAGAVPVVTSTVPSGEGGAVAAADAAAETGHPEADAGPSDSAAGLPSAMDASAD